MSEPSPLRAKLRIALRVFASVQFITVGVLHFTHTWVFEHIVPPMLPAPRLLVHISGVAEIAGGLGLLVPQVRKAAGWGLLALLVAVYPANIHMLVNDVYLPIEGLPQDRMGLWIRMPLQFLTAWFVWISMHDEPKAP